MKTEITRRPVQLDADSWSVPVRILRSFDGEKPTWREGHLTVDDLPTNPSDADFLAGVQRYRPNDDVVWGAV